ncbi:hypothetical protein BY996DRAFT_6427690 [Phakopsora pachyrhizi]|nr:hypothetical protein BY996DRAFT_6427690 [Phakopsora pachyrhizi]
MNDTELHGRRVRVNVANQHVRNSGNNSSELYTNVRPNQNFNHTMTSFPENAAHNYANFPYGGYPNQHPTHPGNNYVCGVSPALNYPMSISSQYDGAHSEMPIIDNSKGGGQSAGYYPVPGPYGYPPVGYGPQPY